MKSLLIASVSFGALSLAACATPTAPVTPVAVIDPAPATPAAAGEAVLTADAARAFVAEAEADLFKTVLLQARADWVNNTYVNEDSDAVSAYFGGMLTEKQVKYAKEAAKYAQVPGLDPDTQRKLNILRTGLSLAAPDRPGAAEQLSTLTVGLQSMYARGRATIDGKVIPGDEAETLMGSLRNPAKTKEVWQSWHERTGRPMREDYTKMVALANEGAQGLGFANTGEMWRSKYDMTPAEFSAMYDRLLSELKPLYDQLHCYTRTKLSQKHGAAIQPDSGRIRADLLGNMWAQEWANIYDVVAPKGAGDIGYNLTDILEKRKATPEQMVRMSEGFYTSLGLPALPESFYTKSQFVRPRDRDVVCHASAWDVDYKEDLRIKMCIKPTADDFVTIHHELGHNYYQRAYNQLGFLYQDSANDGVHEAIGDFIALSVTPEYLVQIGLLDRNKVPSADKDIGLLLRVAMDKVAFMPFAYLVDKWRWGVFDGSITPANYNQAWVDLKRQYQGIEPPVGRSEADFDPGAKFHIPGNTSYARYFLARVMQFQFYKAACDTAGWQGPLHRCSFYGNKEVGAKLNAMLSKGLSQPWQDTLQGFTGSREISGRPMLEYFAPLQAWLQQQNQGKQCGW